VPSVTDDELGRIGARAYLAFGKDDAKTQRQYGCPEQFHWAQSRCSRAPLANSDAGKSNAIRASRSARRFAWVFLSTLKNRHLVD
jgi:hypothetical protein